MEAQSVQVRYLDEQGKDRVPPTRPRDRKLGMGLDPERLPHYEVKDRDIVTVDFEWRGQPRRLLYVQQDILAPATVPPVLDRFLRAGIDPIR
jgi:hypothetical protein